MGSDTFVAAWVMIDQISRMMTGQKISPPESEGLNVFQFLTKEDITFDPKQGWTGYPDYAERFATLWGVEAPK
jgi:ribose transport system substrate-binding protein